MKRVLSYMLKDYKIPFALVVVCILGSTLATLRGTLFMQSLIDDYIVPLPKPSQQISLSWHPPWGMLSLPMPSVSCAPTGTTGLWSMSARGPCGICAFSCSSTWNPCPSAKADGTVTYKKLEGDITFNDVDFGYEEGKIVLHNIKLYATPGQKIAFVGSTGAGKTTITNLINRFYDIADGKIRYDGININKIKKADLRRSLGMVLQDTHLFTGTVMDNIRYGRLDATDEECIAAAKLANADGFVRRLPDGYQTVLTGDGANLSQGQRQLLAIARAAVADPPVLILDEATSSIDTRTEALVQQGMDGLMIGRTTFVIAHRLSTVKNADCIMVLEHGRIIERGTHDQLIEEKGRYYQLYTGNAIGV